MRKFANVLKYLLGIHISALVVFTIIRVILFTSAHDMLGTGVAPDSEWNNVLIAFIKGLWFDNVIACYIAIVPVAMYVIAIILNLSVRPLVRISNIWFSILYSVAFLISAANIPYFKYFFTPINSSIFEWFEYGSTTLAMAVGEVSYLGYILLFILLSIIYTVVVVLLGKGLVHSIKRSDEHRSLPEFVLVTFLCIIVSYSCFIGMRGRFGYNPIKVSQAYFCRNPFLNQLGLNPVHYLLYSYIDMSRSENRYISLTDSDEAAKYLEDYMSGKAVDEQPVSDTITADSLFSGSLAQNRGKNLVFVIMESMSANFMERFGGTNRVTPFLDSLWNESLSFPNFYSAGVHTNHALFSSLYSYPALMRRNLMKGSVIPTYEYGLPQKMLKAGYTTAFFMTHESQYDNMNGFFRTNGYEEIYAEENYPASEVVNGFGVPDAFLFDYALPVLNSYAAQDKPFFATILTISNHPPYIIPEWFTPQNSEDEYAIVEYADHCLENFFNRAKQEPWFDNTVFVFMGDHGKIVGNSATELPESYNHVPFMIYYPGIEKREISTFAGQMDVAPTLLDIMGIESANSKFGIDLAKSYRDKIFYTSDNAIAVRDRSRLYIYLPSGEQDILYSDGAMGIESVATMDSTFAELKRFGLNMIQAAEDSMREKREIGNE